MPTESEVHSASPDVFAEATVTRPNRLGLGILITLLLTALVVVAGEYSQSQREKARLTAQVRALQTRLDERPVYAAPTQAELAALREKIKVLLGSEAENYGVSIVGLRSGKELSLNAATILPPASVSKLPYALLVLRDAQNGVISLEDTYPVLGVTKAYPSDALYHVRSGTQLTYRELLEYLIHASDNTAMMTLERYLGGRDAFNERVRTELGVELFRDPHETTATEVGKLLAGVWAGDYLDFYHNHFLIYELLGRTYQTFDDRIVAGVEDYDDIFVAHKIGSINSRETGLTYHDAGIIYGPWDDLAVVVLNQHTTESEATQKIQEITRLAYEVFNQVAPPK